MIDAGLRSLLALGVLWHPVRPDVWRHDAPMAASGPLAVVRIAAIRIDARTHRFRLDTALTDYGLRGAWTIDSMPDEAVLALNAGHFSGGWPWGWVVRDGVERQPPGTGTLAMAFVVDSAGIPSLVTPAELPGRRAVALHGFQSYPALLVDGMMPRELRAPGRGVNLTHRDSRLAICLRDDGSLVVAITRFSGLGGAASTLPWGPTVPEMARYMKSLGCARAMLLDGGMSSQLAVKGAGGEIHRWPNWRPVPMGLVVVPRHVSAAGTRSIGDDPPAAPTRRPARVPRNALSPRTPS